MTAKVFNSSQAALNCRKYFVQVLSMFYSAEELRKLLQDIGFTNVTYKTVLIGMLGFHRAEKPKD